MRVALCGLCILACSAPAQIGELQQAEDRERAGEYEAALLAYQQALASCKKLRNARRRRESCSASHLQRAELLETLERPREAVAAYVEAERALADYRPGAAQACFNAGRIYLSLGEDELGYGFLWKSITHYADEGFAADALKRIVWDGRVRAPEHLYRELRRLTVPLANSGIADNLLYYLADLSERELDNRNTARQYYDLLTQRYPKSGFLDDALWHSARLSRLAGDAEGAVRRLRKLLATREVAWGPGSYFSIWLDDAQLELGMILRDDLQRFGAATRALSRLSKDYPASILKDDALFQIALTRQAAGDPAGACNALQELARDYADSKYELSKAPELRVQLKCAP